jgi:hypothetical protein
MSNRTEAQVAASQVNGALSGGPVTGDGKMVSAMNSVKSGITTRLALLPGEHLSDYQTNLDGWVTTLHPNSAGEAQIVATIADTAWRLGRLAELERKRMAANLEELIAASRPGKTLVIAQDTKTGLTEMLGALEDIIPSSVQLPTELAHPINGIISMLALLDLPFDAAAHLREALQRALIGVGGVGEIVTRAHTVEKALTEKLVELENAVEAERERLAEEMVLGDDQDLKRIERRRGAILREQEKQLALLKSVRELAQASPSGSLGSSGQPFLVELKLIGRTSASASSSSSS